MSDYVSHSNSKVSAQEVITIPVTTFVEMLYQRGYGVEAKHHELHVEIVQQLKSILDLVPEAVQEYEDLCAFVDAWQHMKDEYNTECNRIIYANTHGLMRFFRAPTPLPKEPFTEWYIAKGREQLDGVVDGTVFPYLSVDGFTACIERLNKALTSDTDGMYRQIDLADSVWTWGTNHSRTGVWKDYRFAEVYPTLSAFYAKLTPISLLLRDIRETGPQLRRLQSAISKYELVGDAASTIQLTAERYSEYFRITK